MSLVGNHYAAVLRAFALAAACLPMAAQAFESGSTGADGAYNPTVNAVLPVPPNGVFNFTNVNIPAGVTVSFQRNQTNTPVTILASEDVTIAGALHVNGSWGAPVGAAGDGNIGDDGLPGRGGPGGYDGGRGGAPGQTARTEGGHGPGGGGGGAAYSGCSTSGSGGGGGGFASAGGDNRKWSSDAAVAPGGSAYGSNLLLPLVGGSGGGGGSAGSAFHGSGGGGGGGGLLIAASGTVRITGSVRADGGQSGASAGASLGATGGGGSGGAIRIVATRIEGNGAITASGAAAGTHQTTQCRGGDGAWGRIRLEAETITRTAATSPAYTFGEPSTVFIAGLPTLRIASVAGQAAPAQPTGQSDIVLDTDTPNPVVVEFETTGVPVGNTVSLRVSPAVGNPSNVVSPALTGSTEHATASVSVSIPSGPSVLLAQTTYTIIASEGDELAQYAGGERVEQVRLAAALDGSSTVTLITVSGKEFTLPSSTVPVMPTAG
jgi:hypothetical protein